MDNPDIKTGSWLFDSNKVTHEEFEQRLHDVEKDLGKSLHKDNNELIKHVDKEERTLAIALNLLLKSQRHLFELQHQLDETQTHLRDLLKGSTDANNSNRGKAKGSQ